MAVRGFTSIPGSGDPGYHDATPTGLPCRIGPRGSRHHLLDHLAVDVGQAEVAAGVAVGELLVVEAEQVQDRGVQVVDVDLVLDGGEAELVGGAVDVAAP